MNDLRSPSEDRPYQVSGRPAPQSPRLAQDDIDPEYGMSMFDRIRYSRWFPLASVFAAVLIFSGIVSYAYKQGSSTGVNATTPVVMADSKDYKQKPANPGGMDVPFQDAVVFDQLQNKGQTPAEGKVESLLPPPEQPVTTNASAPVATPETVTAEAKTAAVAATASEPAATTIAAPVDKAPAPVAATTAPASSAPAEATKAMTAATTAASTLTSSNADDEDMTAPAVKPAAVAAPVKKPVVKKAVVTTAKPTATTVAKAEAGSYRIQLGAFRDVAAARAAWAKTQKQYSVLAGVTPEFPKADLGAKGVFYRAQGVNLSKASADSFCHTINAGKAGSCIVTH